MWEAEGLGRFGEKEATTHRKTDAMEEASSRGTLMGTKVLLWKLMSRPEAREKSSRIFLRLATSEGTARTIMRVSSVYWRVGQGMSSTRGGGGAPPERLEESFVVEHPPQYQTGKGKEDRPDEGPVDIGSNGQGCH